VIIAYLARGTGLKRRGQQHDQRRPQHAERARAHRDPTGARPRRGESQEQRPCGQQEGQCLQAASADHAQAAHQPAQARGVERPVAFDRGTPHARRHRAHAEPLQDRRRDVDRRDHAVLPSRPRGQLATASAPKPRDGNPQQLAGGAVGGPLHSDQQLSGRPPFGELQQVGSAFGPARQVCDDERHRAAQRSDARQQRCGRAERQRRDVTFAVGGEGPHRCHRRP